MVSIPAFAHVVYPSLRIGNYPLQLEIVAVLVAMLSTAFGTLTYALHSVISDTCLYVRTPECLVTLYPFVLITI